MIAARQSTMPTSQRLTPATLLMARRLADNLRSQASLFHEYRETLLRQRQSLLRNRVEELDAANGDLENLSASLHEAEEERLNLTRSLSESLLGLPATPAFEGWLTRPGEEEALPRCEDLATRLDPDHAATLMAARDTLREAMNGLDRDHLLNARLAENGRRLVHATLAALTHLDGRPGGSRLSTYSRNGAGAPTGGQTRRLFNRKV